MSILAELSFEEADSLLRMIDHDCKEFAGAFYEEDRSKKFRTVWKEVGRLERRSGQDSFVERNWKHFHVHVKHWYSTRMREFLDEGFTPNPMYEKDEVTRNKLYYAVVYMSTMGQSSQAQDVLQLAPGTQQFEGDKTENKYISETYGESIH